MLLGELIVDAMKIMKSIIVRLNTALARNLTNAPRTRQPGVTSNEPIMARYDFE
jgi:hypothetical protein